MKFFYFLLIITLIFPAFVFASFNYPDENLELRDYTTKDFKHPTDENKRIKIQSSGLLHYYDNGFKEIPDLPFPDGLTTYDKKTKVLDVPVWATPLVLDNGKELKLYDKNGVSIYRFSNLISVEKGVSPYQITNLDNFTFENVKVRNKILYLNQELKLRDDILVDYPVFQVEGLEVFVIQPDNIKNKYPVDIYDDTDTTSVNNKDNYVDIESAGSNFGSEDVLVLDDLSNSIKRHLINFTITGGITSDEVTESKLYLYYESYLGGTSNPTGRTVDCYKLTNDIWSETQSTWNIYSTGNNWVSAGGDYVITNPVGGSTTFPASGGVWMNWTITDIVEDAIDNVSGSLNVLVKMNDEASGSRTRVYFTSRDGTSNHPYLEITYTPGAEDEGDILVVNNFDVLVKNQLYFFGVLSFLMVIYILWKK